MKPGSAPEITIPLDKTRLNGFLGIPKLAVGLVVFAHGSGSGRFSPRNMMVAQTLQQEKIGTLLVDLLDETEARDRKKVFDIDLLAQRLMDIAQWLGGEERVQQLGLGLFGASTGAAAALQAAARQPGRFKAIVSRGGRPDLAMDDLPSVTAPTRFIVGGDDFAVVTFNKQAYEKLVCDKDLVIVPGATHLFEEPGALEQVANHASDWFLRHF